MATTKLHPIAKDVLTALEARQGPLHVTEAGRARLEAELDALADDPGLVDAVKTIMALAAHLEVARGEKAAAHALLRVVAGRAPGLLAVQLEGAKRRGEGRARALRSGFARLSAVQEVRRAPRFGARAQGGLTIGAMVASRPRTLR